MQRYSFLFILLLSAFLIFSCERNKYDIDVGNIELDIHIVRYDSMIYGLDEEHFYKSCMNLYDKHTAASEVYFNGLIGSYIVGDSAWNLPFSQVVLDKNTRELHELIFRKFDADRMASLETEFEEAFRHFRYYFPDSMVPAIYSFVSNFSETGVYMNGNNLMIALDMFLGSGSKYYSSLPRYLVRQLDPDYIVPASLKVYFEYIFDPELYISGNDLLDKMIYEGKRILFLKMMVPGIPDSLLFQYSDDQLDDCAHFEGNFWYQLLENEVLYESDQNKISRYLDEGPFTNAPGFAQVKAPPRIGQWIGWRIIQQYLEENEQSAPVDVFFEKDAQRILQKSKYKPKI